MKLFDSKLKFSKQCLAYEMSSVSSNKLSSSKETMTSRITKLLPVKLTTTSLILTLISLKALVGSLVLMLRRGEAKRHRRADATAATEPRRQNGGGVLMVRGRCAMLVVYVCVHLYSNCRFLTASRLRKIDPKNGPQGFYVNRSIESATEGVEPSLSLRRLAIILSKSR